jgi:hypothetical protein
VIVAHRLMYSPPPSPPGMAASPLEDTARALLVSISPDVALERLRALPSPGPRRIYELDVSDGRILRLATMPPPSMARLLRSEQRLVSSEAAVVRWLRGAAAENSRPKVKAESPPDADSNTAEPCSSRGTTGQQSEIFRQTQAPDMDLLVFLPVLLHHTLSPPYLISQPAQGIPLTSLSRALASSERSDIDIQVGQLFRRLSTMVSPSGKFGPAAAVLGPESSVGMGTSIKETANTWTMSFHTMLESILRDGEDMSVTISYAAIRRNFRRFGHILNAITIPRFLVVDGLENSNVLVQSPSSCEKEPPPSVKEEANGQVKAEEVPAPEVLKDIPEQAPPPSTGGDRPGEPLAPKKDCAAPISNVVVTGLVDWSNGVFGDPLLSTIFSDATPGKTSEGLKDEVLEETLARLGLDQESDHDLIQDRDCAGIRLLLYQAYHATCCIVREFYRPKADSSTRELAARKRLNEALRKLDAIDDDDDAKKRHRRPSVETLVSKRLRSHEVS